MIPIKSCIFQRIKNFKLYAKLTRQMNHTHITPKPNLFELINKYPTHMA